MNPVSFGNFLGLVSFIYFLGLVYFFFLHFQSLETLPLRREPFSLEGVAS